MNDTLYQPRWPLIVLLNLLVTELIIYVLVAGGDSTLLIARFDNNHGFRYTVSSINWYWIMWVLIWIEIYASTVCICTFHRAGVNKMATLCHVSPTVKKYGAGFLHFILFAGVLTYTTLFRLRDLVLSSFVVVVGKS